MLSINRILFTAAVASAIGAALMAGGCAAGGVTHAEVRMATTVKAGSAQVMVNGPARLLHVDVRGRQSLNVYSVKRGTDGAVDCADKVRSEIASLRQGTSNQLNVEVRGDEAVCLANESSGADHADVSWHARRASGEPTASLQASNF